MSSPVAQEQYPAAAATTTPEIGVILGHVGTPQTTKRSEVRRYLKEFLSDQRIIDLPSWRWQPILRGAILPTRPLHVGKFFEEIWTEEGSPLQLIAEAQRDGIQERLGPRFRVELGMSYSHPSIGEAVETLKSAGITKIVVLPMFPQYANSTIASIYDTVMLHALGRGKGRAGGLPEKKYIPTLRFIHPYYNDPEYIEVLAGSVRRQLEDVPEFDRLVISFHGEPRRFIDEGDPYEDQIHETISLLGEALGLPESKYELGYQSRFGRTEWLKPYLQPRLEELHSDGVQAPVIISPGFTADCLETLHELAIQGRELFEKGGGDGANYRTIRCLNDDPAWLDYAARLIEKNAVNL
nr:ferrochelatase [Actinomycetales bacterium]